MRWRVSVKGVKGKRYDKKGVRNTTKQGTMDKGEIDVVMGGAKR